MLACRIHAKDDLRIEPVATPAVLNVFTVKIRRLLAEIEMNPGSALAPICPFPMVPTQEQVATVRRNLTL